MTSQAQRWALALYGRSVIKQEKLRRIREMIDRPEDRTCLDIGGDNGVISYLLRRMGGSWVSADLDEASVASIREVVGSEVYRIDPRQVPFGDSSFDMVVVVDFLEHIEADREFCRELHRILKPGGCLVVNVPHLMPGSWINRIRNAIGLTDERHGHVRPGYDIAGLCELTGGRFALEKQKTYSRAFSELVDTLLNAAYGLRKGTRESGGESPKGTVVTRDSLDSRKNEFRLLSLVYPFLWFLVRLDRLLVFQRGYKLIARFRRIGS